jgi:hypothetical protein
MYEPLIGSKSIQFANGEEGLARRKRYLEPAFNQESIARIHKNVMDQTITKDVMPILDKAAESGTKIGIRKFTMSSAFRQITKSSLGFKVSDEEINHIERRYDLVMDELEALETGA